MNTFGHSARAAVLVAIGSTSSVALAQYVGPGAPAAPAAYATVADVLRAPVDDRPVELTGVLLRQTGHDIYRFSDGTGEIRVEIDAEDFPRGVAVDAATRVTIVGDVDTRALREPEIDVDRVTIAGPP